MAQVLRSLFKRIQEGAFEIGDAIHGDRIERGLDQDIREVDLHLHQARSDAAAIKAQRITRNDEARQSKAAIAAAEFDVRDQLARRRHSQARDKAALVIALLDEHAMLLRECKQLKDKEAEFAKLIAQLEHQLRRAKHQLGTLRAATGIQRAQAVVAKMQPGPAPHPESAQASVQRARQRATKGGGANPASGYRPRVNRTPGPSDAEVAIDALIKRLSTPSTTTVTSRTTRKPR